MTRERNFSAHHKLLGAARAAVKVAEAGQEGWSLSVITAITLCGLAVEAICNAIGDRVVVDWDDFEAAPPKAKLRLLCDKLDVPYDKGREPWGTLMWLLRVRNAIAHAKPELIQEEHHMTREEYEERHYEHRSGEDGEQPEPTASGPLREAEVVCPPLADRQQGENHHDHRVRQDQCEQGASQDP